MTCALSEDLVAGRLALSFLIPFYHTNIDVSSIYVYIGSSSSWIPLSPLFVEGGGAIRVSPGDFSPLSEVVGISDCLA